MSGRYLECDRCGAHFDLEGGKLVTFNHRARDAGWIEDPPDRHFCCYACREAYYRLKLLGFDNEAT